MVQILTDKAEEEELPFRADSVVLPGQIFLNLDRPVHWELAEKVGMIW
jgi:hypothetical protein